MRWPGAQDQQRCRGTQLSEPLSCRREGSPDLHCGRQPVSKPRAEQAHSLISQFFGWAWMSPSLART